MLVVLKRLGVVEGGRSGWGGTDSQPLEPPSPPSPPLTGPCCPLSPSERSVAALERIGPSVFNAVVSTMLAVIVLSFSKSYVFRIFFKSLFLTVTLGGSHGLIFLPAVLSLFGGSKRPEVAETTEHVEVTSQANDEDEKLGKGGGKGHGPVTVSDDV